MKTKKCSVPSGFELTLVVAAGRVYHLAQDFVHFPQIDMSVSMHSLAVDVLHKMMMDSGLNKVLIRQMVGMKLINCVHTTFLAQMHKVLLKEKNKNYSIVISMLFLKKYLWPMTEHRLAMRVLNCTPTVHRMLHLVHNFHRPLQIGVPCTKKKITQ